MYLLKIKTLIIIFYNLIIRSKFIQFRIIENNINKFQISKTFDKNDEYNNIAIVMQGNVINEDNFTINTLLLYRKMFPKIKIILSTWEISNFHSEILINNNIKILINKKPFNSGISNINLQIISTISGIQYAKECNVKYVLKTRTDQRIFNYNIFNYFLTLMNKFPPEYNQNVRSRIIGISLNTFKYRLYGLSDMLQFGYTEDIELYWSAPIDTRIPNKFNLSKRGVTWLDFSKWNVCETYMLTNFLINIKVNFNYTLENYLGILGSYFIIVDTESIELFWRKYTFNMDRYDHMNVKYPQISFNDWLTYCTNKNERLLNESILNTDCK